MNDIPDKCPQCGSDNITKLSLQKKKSSSSGCGCVGCLIMVIIFLIAPWILPLFGLGALAGMGGIGLIIQEYPVLVFLGIVGVVGMWGYDAYRKSRTYLCMRCGEKFMWTK